MDALTNGELIATVSQRDDLTALEHQLLDRLIRAEDALAAMEKDLMQARAAVMASTTRDAANEVLVEIQGNTA